MDELAALLSRERLLLELLLFKLVELRHLLVSGEGRFLAWAAEEVERATTKVREIELRRALLVDRMATAHGLPDDARTLSALAERAEPPYRAMYEDDRAALLALTTEVEQALEVCRRLATAGSHAVREVLDRITDEPAPAAMTGASTYGSAGTWTPPPPRAQVETKL